MKRAKQARQGVRQAKNARGARQAKHARQARQAEHARGARQGARQGSTPGCPALIFEC